MPTANQIGKTHNKTFHQGIHLVKEKITSRRLLNTPLKAGDPSLYPINLQLWPNQELVSSNK